MLKWSCVVIVVLSLSACGSERPDGADQGMFAEVPAGMMPPQMPDPAGAAGEAAPFPMTPVQPAPMEPLPPIDMDPSDLGDPAEEPPMEEPPMEEPPMFDPPPFEPVYRIELRVHIGESAMTDEELLAALNEMNDIWLAQAAICFEIHTVTDDQVMSDGYDFWFLEYNASSGANGMYSGPHNIWTLDQPSLGSSPNPVMMNAARTSAHELGHVLTLNHTNCGAPCSDALMASGKKGYKLEDFEVDQARGRAQQKALPDLEPLGCGVPMIAAAP